MAQCRLTERMTLQKYDVASKDENGFPSQKWDEEYYNCWCAFRSVSGKEYFEAKANNTENIVTFTVRYCAKTKELVEPGATKIYRIFYKGFLYDIQYASDYQDEHEWIDIKCKINS